MLDEDKDKTILISNKDDDNKNADVTQGAVAGSNTMDFDDSLY